MSFNLQWMERYSNPFGLSSLLKPYGLFSPMWGLSDEITMSLVGNEPGDFEWEAAHTKIFQHSYSRSLAMDNSTRQILDRAQLDVNNSGIEARKLLLLSVPCLPHLLWHTRNSFMKNRSLISCFFASQVLLLLILSQALYLWSHGSIWQMMWIIVANILIFTSFMEVKDGFKIPTTSRE